jgi:restriction system protein
MIQPFEYFMLPLLKIVAENKNILFKDAVSIIQKQESYGEDDLRQMNSSRSPVISHRIGWARTYLKKAGLIFQSAKKAPLEITEKGSLLSSKGLNSLNVKYLREHCPELDAWIKEGNRRPRNRAISNNNVIQGVANFNNSTPEEMLVDTYKTIKTTICNDLLEQLRLMNPYKFEKVILDLLVQMGYGKAIGTPYSNDEGIDGIINKDLLGLEKIYIQVKRYQINNKVGRPDLQAFIGSIHNKDSKGLFITTSDFTAEAAKYAEHANLVVINGEQLANLMFDYDFGVQTRNTMKIKQLDEDFFAEE